MTDRVIKPITQLPVDQVLVAPSILAADFSRLGEDVKRVEEAGAQVLHIDIMDGHFVPNISMGPCVVSSLRKVSNLVFDVHLMLTDPGRYVEAFAKAGADCITIHVESAGHLEQVLAEIKSYGCAAGITMRPGTPASSVLPYLPLVDLVMVMTVEPGFGGQSFMAGQLEKISYLHKAIAASGRSIHLEVDGGVGAGNAQSLISAGVNLLVAGSSVFHSPLGVSEAMRVLSVRG